jgi:hypothetical protein
MRPSGITGRPSPRDADPRATVRIDSPERAYVNRTFLGRFRTVGFLGEGSNAQVFLAHKVSDPTSLVVVKRIKPQVTANPRFRQFFDAEVRSMARFSHPYAVGLIDASLDDPLGPCMVIEYIPGFTLEAVLNRYGRLSVDRVGRLLGPLCHALQAAHDAGIVHRDLKPANLMVTKVDTAAESLRVMDFGFAGFSAKPHIQLAELTGQGSVYACGTPAYVSPEMVRGDPVDARADLYSVGVILYEMLSGRLPFDRQTQQELVSAHVHESPPRFGRVGAADVPPTVEAVVQLALSKYPSERQQSARQLAEHFSRAVGFDIWAETAPAGRKPPAADDDIVVCTLAPAEAQPAEPEDRFVLFDQFEAMMPEKLAAAKLRGFIQDSGGMAVDSEPGLIRLRLDMPPGWKEPGSQQSSGLFSKLFRGGAVPKGREPIEVDLRMEKRVANRVSVLVSFRPIKSCMPDNVAVWKERCERIYDSLRKHLMA